MKDYWKNMQEDQQGAVARHSETSTGFQETDEMNNVQSNRNRKGDKTLESDTNELFDSCAEEATRASDQFISEA